MIHTSACIQRYLCDLVNNNTKIMGLQSNGLTSEEARTRLAKFGPNAVPDTSLHPLRNALDKFWAPVPWMLEASIVLELVLGKCVEAGIFAALLAFNCALGFIR